MNRLARTALVIAAVAGAVYVLFYPTKYQWRQKLTLTVETPAGEVSGAAVVQISVTYHDKPSGLSGGMQYTDSLRGEATVVEVLPGRYLFALLGNNLSQFWKAAPDRFSDRDVELRLKEVIRQTEPVTLTSADVPMLVTFDDINDPTSVRQVDPKNLAASFGPGVSLTSATLGVTDEPVTEGRVEEVLGWLGPYPETRLLLNTSSTDFSVEAQLEQGQFVRRP